MTPRYGVLVGVGGMKVGETITMGPGACRGGSKDTDIEPFMELLSATRTLARNFFHNSETRLNQRDHLDLLFSPQSFSS